jgi:hypothetical protein
MSYEEKNTWAFGVIAVVGYAAYLVLSFALGGGPLGAGYIGPMVGTILGAIVAGIVVGIALGILNPKDGRRVDQRDREISWFGERAGNSFIVIGGLAALILCFTQAPHAWIANVLYLGFVLSAILTSLVKLSAYHRGF